MTSRRRPKQSPTPEAVPTVQFTPGEVIQRPDAEFLAHRVATLENLFDLMCVRLAFTESSLNAALERIRLLQQAADKDLIGI